MTDKLIILTDLGTLKALRLTHHELTGKPQIKLVDQRDPVAPHLRVSDVVTDQAGRFPMKNGVIGAGQMSNGENLHLEQEAQRRTVKLLAESIEEILDQEKVNGWYFAANPQIDQKILEQLSGPTRSRMQKHVRADLTKIDKEQLLRHFE